MIGLEDVEIELLTPGPIIHLFPKRDPFETFEHILTSIQFTDNMKKTLLNLEEQIKSNEQPDYIIMAYAELHRIIKNSLLKAEKYSLEFMEKKKFGG